MHIHTSASHNSTTLFPFTNMPISLKFEVFIFLFFKMYSWFLSFFLGISYIPFNINDDIYIYIYVARHNDQ